MGSLIAKHLTKIYFFQEEGMVKALDRFSLTLHSGELVGIVGPSGSGKTTLLNILATLDHPTAGDLFINEVSPVTLGEKGVTLFRRQHIGFMFPEPRLLSTLTVKENLMLPLVLKGLSPRGMAQEVEAMAAQLGIGGSLHQRPNDLTVEEQYRVACARAAIHRPSFIFVEEPIEDLDRGVSLAMVGALRRIQEIHHPGMLMVTRDPYVASFCDRVLVLQKGKMHAEFSQRGNQMNLFQQLHGMFSRVGGKCIDIA